MFDIHNELKNTINNEIFLLLDTHRGSGSLFLVDRVFYLIHQCFDFEIKGIFFVFASASNIKILKRQKQQIVVLLTIHCIVIGYVIPLLYTQIIKKNKQVIQLNLLLQIYFIFILWKRKFEKEQVSPIDGGVELPYREKSIKTWTRNHQ